MLRSRSYHVFADLINGIYERYANGADVHDKKSFTDEVEMLNHVLEVIRRTHNPAAAPSFSTDTDLFALGVDSLQAIRIRNALQRTIQFAEGAKLGQNVVYEQQTPRRLAKHLIQLSSGLSIESGLPVAQEMFSLRDEMAAKIKEIPRGSRRSSRSSAQDGHTVVGALSGNLLTGTAGDGCNGRIGCTPRAFPHVQPDC